MKIPSTDDLVLPKKAKSTVRRPIRIGLTYNLKRVLPADDGANDQDAEFDSESTVEHIAHAISSFGHEVVKIEADAQIISSLRSNNVDLVFNIAEGIRGRGRESLVPSLLDLLDIEYTGSDSTTMAVTLDKFIAKQIVSQHGVLTAKSFLMHNIKDKMPAGLSFPLFMKPVAEGSSKGISASNVVLNETELRDRASIYLKKYSQPLLVEEYVAGREFTVGVLGCRKLTVLPIMEIEFLNPAIQFPVYSFEYKLKYCDDINFKVPAEISAEQKRQLELSAKLCFQHLGCRDVARIDFRMDAEGKIYFIECNPIPGLVPDWSDLCLMSNKSGMDYHTLIGTILSPALKRLKDRKKSTKKLAATATTKNS